MADESKPRDLAVELRLLSGEDTQAAKDLANSLKQIADAFKAIKEQDFIGSAQKMNEVAKQMAQSAKDMGTQMAQRGGQVGDFTSTPDRAAEATRDVNLRRSLYEAHRETTDARTGLWPGLKAAMRPGEGSWGERFMSRQKPDIGEPGSGASLPPNAEEYALGQGGRGGGGRGGAVRTEFGFPSPGDPNYNPRAWQNNVDFGKIDEPFQLPRFGELTIQDYLNMLSTRRTRQALGPAGEARNLRSQAEQQNRDLTDEEQGQINDLTEQSDRYGGKAAAYKYLADNVAPQLYTAHRIARSVIRTAVSQGINPNEWEQRGAALGYERGPNVGPLHIPFGAAGGEGFRQQMDIYQLRLKGGINNEQAQAINAASAGAGFGGDLGHQVSYQLMAPMMQKYGANPQNFVPFLQALRTGTAGVGDLTSALGDLGQTTREANMHIDQTTEALAKVVEQTQEMGGTTLGGIRTGTAFQQTFGLPADLSGQVAQSGFTQAHLAAQTGIPGNLQGALPATARLQGGLQAMQRVYSMYAGQNGRGGVFPSVDTPITDPTTGEVIAHQHTAGSEFAYAATGQQFGLNAEQTKKMLNRRGAYAALQARGLAEAYSGRNTRIANDYRRHPAQSVEDVAKAHGISKKHLGAYTIGADGMPVFKDSGYDDSIGTSIRKWMKDDAGRFATDHTRYTVHGNNQVEWGELRAMADRAGVKPKTLDKIRRETEGHAGERARRVTHELNKVIDDANTPQLHVKFTGPAAKMFKGFIKNADKLKVPNYGDNGANAASASPVGPNPLPDPLGYGDVPGG